MLADVTDTALIAGLRTSLERAGAELEVWHRQALTAVETAQQLSALLTEVAADRDALSIRGTELAGRVTELETLVEALRCGELSAFMDGELPPDREQAYREHLTRCRNCHRELHDQMRAEKRMREAAPHGPRGG